MIFFFFYNYDCFQYIVYFKYLAFVRAVAVCRNKMKKLKEKKKREYIRWRHHRVGDGLEGFGPHCNTTLIKDPGDLKPRSLLSRAQIFRMTCPVCILYTLLLFFFSFFIYFLVLNKWCTFYHDRNIWLIDAIYVLTLKNKEIIYFKNILYIMYRENYIFSLIFN